MLTSCMLAVCYAMKSSYAYEISELLEFVSIVMLVYGNEFVDYVC